MLEALDLPQLETRRQGPERRIQIAGWDLETPVEPGQKRLEHGLGLFHGGGPRQPEFGDQPVLENPCSPFLVASVDSRLGIAYCKLIRSQHCSVRQDI